MMKEIVVISGKGGTGKTSVTAAFAVLDSNRIMLADCDVDAANMHIIMGADFAVTKEFVSGEVAIIDQDICMPCGICAEKCQFDAIRKMNGHYEIVAYKCEGCGLCARICPYEAIRNEEVLAGKYFISGLRTGGNMVHARLFPGASNSGKLVSLVKEVARREAEEKQKDIILIDGSPGIGCPVISSLSGASSVILVTEPSLSGLHDLKRIVALVENFNIPACCILNKSNLNDEVGTQLKDFLDEKKIELVGEIPYHPAFNMALMEAKTVVELNDKDLYDKIVILWEKILELNKL